MPNKGYSRLTKGYRKVLSDAERKEYDEALTRPTDEEAIAARARICTAAKERIAAGMKRAPRVDHKIAAAAVDRDEMIKADVRASGGNDSYVKAFFYEGPASGLGQALRGAGF